jgi:F0F1-type ATP synthase assembly protein I
MKPWTIFMLIFILALFILTCVLVHKSVKLQMEKDNQEKNSSDENSEKN